MLNYLLEPFAYPFMQTALFTAIVVAIVCAVLSCYLVLKSWSLMGDAISHAVLPGIVLGYIAGTPLMIGAFCSGLVSALCMGYIKENSRIKEDTAIGIVFSGMFALGLVLFTKIETDQHLMHVLFGNLLGIHQEELIQTLLISITVFIVLKLKQRDFLLFCFNPTQASIVGLSAKKLYYGLLVLLVMTIITAMQVVGVILVVAMLISPGITAYLLTKHFARMVWLAVISAVLSSLFGTIASYHLNADIGPSIILVQALFFCLALVYHKLAFLRRSAV
ncbi:metal ABC transporter permease [Pasteurellaceae bacterium LIM206]|nr:metal ABC transporter permease [Pasteurellaceae bacterium LIM206]